MATVAEAYRNLSCVGAEPVAITNCLNFGNPEKPEGYYQLAECIEGMAEACEALGTPVVSGNVSLFNETERGAVYPTPVVGMVGVLEDVRRTTTPGFKREGDEVVAIGKGWRASLAGSDYLETIHGKVTGTLARPDLATDKKCSDLVRSLVSAGILDTVHDVSRGGLAVALAEMAMAGGIGVEYEEIHMKWMIEGVGGRDDVALFGEADTRFLVAVPQERWEVLQDALGDVPYDNVGQTGGDRLIIPGLVDIGIDEMRGAYEQDLFGSPGDAPGGTEVTP
jgi:phosphoribosylformylglycinamidine synthase